MTIPVRKGTQSKQMNKFSHSSNDAELYELLKKIQNGEMGVFEQLLKKYERLIDAMTHRFSNAVSAADIDDLRQEATLAIYRAAMRYDIGQSNVQFGLFAKMCIQNRLVSHLRKLKKQENVVLLEDGLSSVEPEDPENDPATRLIEEESYLTLSKQVRGALSEQENRIWWLYLSGRTAKEIAVLIGKDEKSVQNSIYRIRRKLRTVISYS